jgi:hypothetical protein
MLSPTITLSAEFVNGEKKQQEDHDQTTEIIDYHPKFCQVFSTKTVVYVKIDARLAEFISDYGVYIGVVNPPRVGEGHAARTVKDLLAFSVNVV